MLDAPDSDYLAAHSAEISSAADRIRPFVRRTPTLTSDLGADLRLKAECFQVSGSFKARGAFNAVLRLRAQHPQVAGVATVSSGNHAQAVALAARAVGLAAVILIPEDANPGKVAATKALGAEVIQEGVTFANREERLQKLVRWRGLAPVHPFDDWDVIHGQATAAKELLEDAPEVGTVVAPCGGAGLLSGTALAVKAHDPRIRVVGVEPERAADAQLTLRTGHLQRLPSVPLTLADGARPLSIGEKAFEVLVKRKLVDDIVTVSEDEIVGATRAAWLVGKLALEPTGALPLAAHLAGKLPPADRPFGLILSGGNADLALVARLLNAA